MDWKLGYGSLGLIALLLTGGLVWSNLAYAPVEVPAAVVMQPAPVLDPYPELEGKLVHINTATAEELEQLPDIGPKKAKLIREHIKKYGKLASEQELLEIEGIGKKTLEKLKPYIILD